MMDAERAREALEILRTVEKAPPVGMYSARDRVVYMPATFKALVDVFEASIEREVAREAVEKIIDIKVGATSAEWKETVDRYGAATDAYNAAVRNLVGGMVGGAL